MKVVALRHTTSGIKVLEVVALRRTKLWYLGYFEILNIIDQRAHTLHQVSKISFSLRACLFVLENNIFQDLQ